MRKRIKILEANNNKIMNLNNSKYHLNYSNNKIKISKQKSIKIQNKIIKQNKKIKKQYLSLMNNCKLSYRIITILLQTNNNNYNYYCNKDKQKISKKRDLIISMKSMIL